MKMTRAVIAVAVAMSTLAAFGQDATRRALAEELLERANIKESMEKSLAMVKQAIPTQLGQMQKAYGQTNDAAKVTREMDQVMDVIAKELSWDNLKESYISLYAETFTKEELEGIIAFYKSPAGQAYTKKLPQLMQKSMELSQKLIQQVMPRIQAMASELQSNSKPAVAAPKTTP